MRERARARRRLFFVVSQLMLLLFERHQKQWAYGVRKDKNSGKKKHTRMKRASRQAREEREEKRTSENIEPTRVLCVESTRYTSLPINVRGSDDVLVVGSGILAYTIQILHSHFGSISRLIHIIQQFSRTRGQRALRSGEKEKHCTIRKTRFTFPFADVCDRTYINTLSHKCHQIAWSFRFRRRTSSRRKTVRFPSIRTALPSISSSMSNWSLQGYVSISSNRSAQILREVIRSEPFVDKILSDSDEKKRMTSRSNRVTSARSC